MGENTLFPCPSCRNSNIVNRDAMKPGMKITCQFCKKTIRFTDDGSIATVKKGKKAVRDTRMDFVKQ
jgi:ribosomal protein S27E